jgi:hypothetical protein
MSLAFSLITDMGHDDQAGFVESITCWSKADGVQEERRI